MANPRSAYALAAMEFAPWNKLPIKDREARLNCVLAFYREYEKAISTLMDMYYKAAEDEDADFADLVFWSGLAGLYALSHSDPKIMGEKYVS